MPKTPLPEYGALLRWTVQDVVNWLGQNGFNDCIKCFRESDIDGNRLMHIEEQDLKGIGCPNKKIKHIMKMVMDISITQEQLGRLNRPAPKTWSPPVSHGQKPPTPAAQPPPTRRGPPPPQEPDYDSDDGDGGWGSDFSSDSDDGGMNGADNNSDDSYEEPVAPVSQVPPRPDFRSKAPAGRAPGGRAPAPAPGPPSTGRRAPPPAPSAEEQDEFYEEPDADVVASSTDRFRRPPPSLPREPSEDVYEDPDSQVVVQAIHPGPLPKPPSHQRQPAPLPEPIPPQRPTRHHAPSIPAPAPPVEFSQDVYEPVIESTPTVLGRRQRAPEPEPEQEAYEVVPDILDSKVDNNPLLPTRTPRDKKSQPVLEQDENYLDMSQSTGLEAPPAFKAPALPTRDGHPNMSPRFQKRRQEPVPLPEDVYEVPPTEEDPVPLVRGKHKGGPPPPALVQEENYMEPDAFSEPPPPEPPRPRRGNKNPGHGGVAVFPTLPQPTVPSARDVHQLAVDDEDYVVPDAETLPEPPKPRGTSRTPSRGHHGLPQPPPPVKEPSPAPVVEDEYEEPDRPEEIPPEPPKPRHAGRGGISVLPNLPGLPSVPKTSQHGHERHNGSIPEEKTKSRKLPQPPPVEASVPSQGAGSTRRTTQDDIESQPWYFGLITRKEADDRLKKHKQNGMYLIRKSERGGEDRPYTLVLYYDNRVYNLPIRKRDVDSHYAVGAEKDDEHHFKSLKKMVEFFSKNFLVLQSSGDGQTQLKKTLPR